VFPASQPSRNRGMLQGLAIQTCGFGEALSPPVSSLLTASCSIATWRSWPRDVSRQREELDRLIDGQTEPLGLIRYGRT